MAEPKPIASLSSGLLARKGQARPAMRPQGFGGMVGLPQPIEDLGWNDMGEDAPAPPPPAVLRQRESLAERVVEPSVDASADAAVESVEPVAEAEITVEAEPVAAARRQPSVAHTLRAATGKAGKAAFTLRLPADRHLRLRLACAVRHQSAQQLVTEALDRLLSSIPEVEELARQLPDRTAR